MTTGMNSLLGDVFGTKTASAHTEEDLEKQANLQFFGELCQAEGIDLSQLNDTQAEELFKVAMSLKEAAEEEAEKEEKKEEAARPLHLVRSTRTVRARRKRQRKRPRRKQL